MPDEERRRRIAWFDAMVGKGTIPRAMTWCIRLWESVPSRSLKGRVCLACRHFTENGGPCDPL